MTKPIRLLCAGHSHLACLMRANRENFNAPGWNFEAEFMRLQAPTYQPNFDPESKETRITDVIRRHMRHKAVTKPADAMIGVFFGNEFNAIAMLNQSPPFDFRDPGDDTPIADGVVPVPRAAIRRLLELRIDDRAVHFIKLARETYDGPIAILPPPPPIADEGHILAHPGRFGDMARKMGVSPAPMRRRIWQLYCDVLKERVEAAGARFLPPPPQAFNDEGFFKSDYWHTDPTHGNPIYGKVVIEYILKELFSVTPERAEA